MLAPLGGLAPRLGEILDPPLLFVKNFVQITFRVCSLPGGGSHREQVMEKDHVSKLLFVLFPCEVK